MADAVAILFLSDDAWRLAAVDASGRETTREIPVGIGGVDAVAEGVREAMVMVSPGADTLVLAIPASWCFSTRLDRGAGKPSPGSRAWRRAKLFEMEERLPLAAEDLVADFVIADDDALGICTRIEPLRRAIDALGQCGFRVAAASPSAVLVLEHWRTRTDEEVDALLVGEPDGLSLMLIERGTLRGWHLLPHDAGDVAARLALLRSESTPLRLATVGVDDLLLAALRTDDAVTLAANENLRDRFVIESAAEAVTHARRPMIDFCRDELEPSDRLGDLRTPLVSAVGAAAVLLISLLVALLVVAARYDRQAAVLAEQQASVFRETFPEARDVPGDVFRRLVSEHRRMTTQAGSPEGMQSGPSALLTLRDVFDRLPDDFGYRLHRIRIDGRSLEVVGEVSSHQEAGRLSAAIGSDGHFRVDPPQTNAQRQGGVGFTLRATVVASEVSP